MRKISLTSLKEKGLDSDLLICGIDEAGRGPVLGPMVICGVCFDKAKLSYLTKIGVKDSKKLTLETREELSRKIKKNCHSFKTIIVSPKEIDEREKNYLSLNRLEELKMAELLNELKPSIIYLDAADVKEDRFGKSIGKLLNYPYQNIISKHKADDLYPIVSAASIIAKDKRDSIIKKIKQDFGEIGSGYPSDEKTITFLREYLRANKKVPEFVRKSWKTAKRIIDEEMGTRKITEFF